MVKVGTAATLGTSAPALHGDGLCRLFHMCNLQLRVHLWAPGGAINPLLEPNQSCFSSGHVPFQDSSVHKAFFSLGPASS